MPKIWPINEPTDQNLIGNLLCQSQNRFIQMEFENSHQVDITP